MSELERFSTLVGAIYDAALDPTLWPDALKRLCEFLPGACANIFVQDARNQYANSIFTYGVDPAYFKSYLETYARANPLFPTIFFQRAGDVFSVFDLMRETQFERSRFYREWVAPQNLHDSLAGILEKSSTSCAMVAVPLHRAQGLATPEMREKMALVMPHITRAVLVSKAFDLQRTLAANLAAAVDGLSAAIYLLDPDRRIAHANRSALAILAAGDVLYSIGPQLHARDAAVNRSLGELFAASRNGDDLAMGSRGMALYMPSRGGSHYVAHVLPLMAGARRDAAMAHRAFVCLVVHNAAQSITSSPEVLAKAFGLTPREVGVLLAIVEVGGVPAVADQLGLTQATVKSYLRQVFGKTGTSRQAELVRLVAQFMSPVS